MRLLVFMLASLFVFNVFSAAAAGQAAKTRAAAPAGQGELVPGTRMVHAVQFPFDQKVKFTLFPTGRLKDIEGAAEVKRKKTIEVEVEVNGPPASELKPEYRGYVIWALTPAGKFHPLGSLEKKGTLKTSTNIPAFGIVVTAESDLNAVSPTDAVLESGMPEAKRRYYPIRRVFYSPAVQ